MCYDDFEGEDLSSDWHCARKAHRCFACRETIRPGDSYHSTVQLYEGKLNQFKHCARCWAMAEAILEKNGSVQWDLHCGETWQENFGPPPDPIAALRVPDSR